MSGGYRADADSDHGRDTARGDDREVASGGKAVGYESRENLTASAKSGGLYDEYVDIVYLQKKTSSVPALLLMIKMRKMVGESTPVK
jgi:hypothetical protein